jgi:hypothetical protein
MARVTTATEATAPASAVTDGHERLVSELEDYVDRLVTHGVDELQVAQCVDELSRLETVARKVKARQTQLVGAISRHERAAAAARRDGRDEHGRHLETRRAERGVQDRLVAELNWSPTDARKAARASQVIGSFPVLAAAYRDGRITDRHLEVAADTLRHFDDTVSRELEVELTEVARSTSPVAFSTHCRRLLATRAHDAAMRDERRRHARRSMRMATGPDGMLHVSGRLAGLDAEVVAAAVKAFRRPDTADVPVEDRRPPDQVTADAFAELCRVALGAAESPTRHGARPHIVVTIDYRTLLTERGAVDVDQLGVLPFAEVRRLLADAGVSRILVDPEQVPLEAGQQVRTVPIGLWRALRLRDRGCIAPGCSVPADWCQVAHLEQPYRLDGRLSPLNAALMCAQHHTRYDRDGWRIVWRGQRPTLAPPRAAPPTARANVASEKRARYHSSTRPGYRDPPPRVRQADHIHGSSMSRNRGRPT